MGVLLKRGWRTGWCAPLTIRDTLRMRVSVAQIVVWVKLTRVTAAHMAAAVLVMQAQKRHSGYARICPVRGCSIGYWHWPVGQHANLSRSISLL